MTSNAKGLTVVLRWFRLVWADSRGTLALIISLSFGSAILLTAFPWLWQFLVDAIHDDAQPVRLRELAGWMAAIGFAQFLLYIVLQGARSVMNVTKLMRNTRIHIRL